MKKLAVLISNIGTGTNLQAIIDATENRQSLSSNKKINAQIIAVISDTPESPGLSRAKKHKIPTVISEKRENLIKVLQKYKPDYVCLAGWKQIITDEVIDAYPGRILNTHPGLIPDTMDGKVLNPDGTKALWNKGKMTRRAMQNFLENNATYAGCSNHFLTHEFDFGPVLGRCFEKIRNSDTIDSLYTRLKKKENELYVDVLQKLCLATVLVIDGGGRGSVLVEKYAQSPSVSQVLATPGNDLMIENSKKIIRTFPNIKTTDIKNIAKVANEYKVDFVDVAQDNAVEVGVADVLLKQGFQVFGPTKAAGQIEWDKAWARNFMKTNGIPCPAFKICKGEKEGIDFIKSQKNGEWFIKASGLAAGKGVIYARNNKEANSAISQMKSFGKSGETFLIEECLQGEEFSSFAFVDGSNFIIVGHAQDHKRVFDGEEGPNTGGMGCSSPPKAVTPKIEKQINLIFQKTVTGLVKIKRPYKGVLYLGGMIVKGEKLAHRSSALQSEGRVYVIEFNARWGDPEAQVIVPSIKNDLFEMEQQILNGNIKKIKLKKDNKYRIVIAAASKGYPNDYSKVTGKRILGLESFLSPSSFFSHPERSEGSNVQILGAGVKVSGKKYTAAGGRLFYVLAEGMNVREARTKAYNALSKIKMEGNNLHYRHDIGWRDIERMRNPERSRRMARL